MLNVFIDQWSLEGPGSDRGLGRYSTQILQAASASKSWRAVPVRNVSGTRSLARTLAAVADSSDGVYHSTSAYHLPLTKRMPWVCSIQDIIPLDLPDYRRLGIKTRLVFRNATRSDVILANSRYTADRVMDRLGIDARRIVVGSLPVSSVYAAAAIESSTASDSKLSAGPYVVALADLRTPDPRKRYHWISDFAAGLRRRGIRTIVTGRGIGSGSFGDCECLPDLDDRQLASLYAGAVASFYPSAYEGQGLPPLEAMAAGCPVVAFRNSSITEMVGNGGGHLLDDPVPWQSHRLSAPMPQRSIEEAVEYVVGLAVDSKALSSARDRGRLASANLTLEKLTLALETAYAMATHGGVHRDRAE